MYFFTNIILELLPVFFKLKNKNRMISSNKSVLITKIAYLYPSVIHWYQISSSFINQQCSKPPVIINAIQMRDGIVEQTTKKYYLSLKEKFLTYL